MYVCVHSSVNPQQSHVTTSSSSSSSSPWRLAFSASSDSEDVVWFITINTLQIAEADCYLKVKTLMKSLFIHKRTAVWNCDVDARDATVNNWRIVCSGYAVDSRRGLVFIVMPHVFYDTLCHVHICEESLWEQSNARMIIAPQYQCVLYFLHCSEKNSRNIIFKLCWFFHMKYVIKKI